MILLTIATGNVGHHLVNLLVGEADDPRSPTPSGSPTTPSLSGTDGKAMAIMTVSR
jgi:hypothetical protein